jgi:TatD DNase family protein
MRLIDTHAHLDFDKFQDDLDEILARAKEAGLENIVTIGASSGMESNHRALALADRFDHIYATVGIHPHDAKIVDRAAVDTIDGLADHAKVVAIGETGLDYHYDNSPRDEQQQAFRWFVQLARKRELPVIVHTRNADEDTIRILTEEGADQVGGIIHCFSSGAWLAKEALALGFHLSFSGIVTFKKATEVQEVARTAPLDRILVETDAPFLAPMPHRGRRNEPSYVAHTARFIAALREMDEDEFAEATTQNARRLYGLSSGDMPRRNMA